jgi:hypothetical protein
MEKTKFQTELEEYLESKKMGCKAHIGDDEEAMKLPDFEFAKKSFKDRMDTIPEDLLYKVRFEGASMFVEAKEKVKAYNPDNWPTNIPEQYLFICDETTLNRAIIGKYFASMVIMVKDYLTGFVYLYTPMHLLYATKEHSVRAVNGNKYKRMMDLREATECRDIEDAMWHLRKYFSDDCQKYEFEGFNPTGKPIPVGGTQRTAEHRREDREMM